MLLIVGVLLAAAAGAAQDPVQLAAFVSAEDGSVELLETQRARTDTPFNEPPFADTDADAEPFADDSDPDPVDIPTMEPPPPPPPIELEKQTIQFLNASPKRVDLWWMNPAGPPMLLNSIEPMRALDIGFFAGHIFEWHAPGAGEAHGGWPKALKYSRCFLGMKRQVYRGPAVPADELLSTKVKVSNLSEKPLELWLRSTPSRADAPRRKLISLEPREKSEVNLYAGTVVEWVDAEEPEHVLKSAEVEAYTRMLVYADSPPRPPRACADSYPERCAKDSARGECSRNPGWMTVFCGASCGHCHLQDPALRCSKAQLNMSQSDRAWGDADATPEVRTLEDMFESLVGDGERPSRIAERYPHVEVSWLSREPPILHFENFVSDEEGAALIATADGWTRSTDVGAYNSTLGISDKKVSTSRTSNNAWCRDECEKNVFVRRLVARIEEFVAISRANFETFQVLRYERGEQYRRHHDISGAPRPNMPAAGRILTFFLYLSDVEAGGATSFTDLNPPLNVEPKKGSAILWASVHDPPAEMHRDERTFHAALPVERGVKIAANTWISLNPFRVAQKWGCTGSFDTLPA